MLKQIKTTRYAITEEDVLWDEIADLIDHVESMATSFRRNFVPTPKQQELDDIIRYSEAPLDQPLHILLYGSLGSAKSSAAQWKLTEILLDHPGAAVLGVRRTQTQIEKTLWRKGLEFYDKFDIPYNKNFKFLTITLKNSSLFQMVSADRTAKSKNDTSDDLGSTEFSGAVLEEANEIPEEFAKTIPGRLRQNVGVLRKIVFYICNPPSTDHWLYELFFVQHNPDDPKSRYRALHMATKDNPYLPEGYLDSIHEDYADNPMLYMRLVKGLFGPSVKGYPIFQKHFNPLIHIADSSIKEKWDPNQPLVRCWDFGYVHPCIVVFQDDKITGQLRIFDVIQGDKILLDPFADRWLNYLNRQYPGAQWLDVCDPSGARRTDTSAYSSVDILKGKGIHPRMPRHDVAYGLSIIADQLSTMIPYRKGPVSAILIDPSCELIIHALQFGYCQEKDLNDDVIKPVKDGVYDHCMDAFRYGITVCRRVKDGRGLNATRGDQYQTAVDPKLYIPDTYKSPGIPGKIVLMGGGLGQRGAKSHGPKYGYNRSNW